MKADERVDVEDAILDARRIPCLCDRTDRATVITRSKARGILVERVECDTCFKTWGRTTA